MRKYARYKDSGISWIGEVPEHWSYYPFYALFEQKSQCGFCDEELLSVYLDKGVIRFSDAGEKRANATSEDLSKYQLVEEGDFVLNNQQAWRGSVGVSFFRGIVSPAYVILKMSEKLKRTFANYLLRDRSMVAMYCLASKGVGSIQRNLVWNKVKRSAIFIPPLSEQKAIAEYLDKKTAQINELVSTKQKQIELLKEYKQSVIANAVTGKLNKNCRMKDSGISWIGKIPENWKLIRNKFFVEEKDDVVGGEFRKYPLLSLTKGGVILRDVESGKGKFPKDFESYKIVKPGNIIFCLFDVDETPRTVGLSKYEGMITGAYDIFQIKNIDSNFYTYFFLAVDNIKAMRPLYTGLRKVVKKDRFLSYKIPVPPLSEQKEIVAYIEKKISSIDSQITSIENQIANLNEYKQSLISDVVTGKVKV